MLRLPGHSSYSPSPCGRGLGEGAARRKPRVDRCHQSHPWHLQRRNQPLQPIRRRVNVRIRDHQNVVLRRGQHIDQITHLAVRAMASGIDHNRNVGCREPRLQPVEPPVTPGRRRPAHRTRSGTPGNPAGRQWPVPASSSGSSPCSGLSTVTPANARATDGPRRPTNRPTSIAPTIAWISPTRDNPTATHAAIMPIVKPPAWLRRRPGLRARVPPSCLRQSARCRVTWSSRCVRDRY